MTDPFGPPRDPRSVSQLKQFERCPYSYFLARIRKEWQRPAAWLPQGTAVHYAAEWWERGGRTASLEEMIAVFEEAYIKEVTDYLRITRNVDFWAASGPYRGARDIERRMKKGREQTAAYYRYYTELAPKEVIWVAPDGTPGIELGFDLVMDEVRIRGFIDAVIEDRSGPFYGYQGTPAPVKVRDNKTGKNPGDDFQLAVYGVVLTELYDVVIESGDYWMGGSGKPTVPFDLREWPRQRVLDKFHELEENLAKGEFPPDPEPDKCKFCDVAHACEYRAD